ncbi:MAG: hypothetical protein SO022_12510 [Selenomonadaceae bacterium]|nr:hypothetical protein [Selenomonadaceae bacterium]
MGWKTISIQTEKVKDERLETYLKSISDLCKQECYSKALERIEEAEELPEANNDDAKALLCFFKCSVYVLGSMTWKAYSGLSRYSQKIRLYAVCVGIATIKNSSGSDREDDIKILQYMLSEVIDDVDGDINMDGFKYTLLSMACYLKQEDIVRVLLKCGADSHKKVLSDSGWVDPLWTACVSSTCDAGIARTLIKYGANVNERYASFKNRTCLHQIAAAKHWDSRYMPIYKMLVEEGANVNLQDDDGYTPAMLSLDQNWFWSAELDMMNYLLKHGARRDIKAKNGSTLNSIAEKNDVVWE